MRVNFVTNAGKSQFKDKGNGFWVVQGIPMTVDNATMNGVFYPADENASGLNSYRGQPVVLRHPTDNAGNPVSATSGSGLFSHYSGGVITNTYNHNGVNYFDAEFNINMMRAQVGGAEYADKIEKREPIGISTGLYFSGNNESGTDSKGKKYTAVARNQRGDHVAMLPDDEPPAGGDATFIRFNGENDDQVLSVNIDEFISSLSQPDEKGLFERFVEFMRNAAFASDKHDKDNVSLSTQNSKGDDAMRELLIAALAGKGIAVNAEMTDAQLLAKLNESNAAEAATAVNAALKPLTAQIQALQAAVNAGADKELDALAKEAAPLMGVEVADAKSLGVNALHKVLAKHGVVIGTPNATNSQSPSEPAILTKFWEA